MRCLLYTSNHLSGDVEYINEELAGKMALKDGDSEVRWGDGSVTQVAGVLDVYKRQLRTLHVSSTRLPVPTRRSACSPASLTSQ